MSSADAERTPARSASDICPTCSTLTGTLHGLDAACSERGFPHWPSVYALEQSAETCTLCKAVWEARVWDSDEPDSPGKGTSVLHVFAECATEWLGRARDELDSLHPLRGAVLMSLAVWSSYKESVEPLVRLYACARNTDDDDAEFTFYRQPLDDLASDSAIEQATEWLHECSHEHAECNSGGQTALPTFTLDVGGGDGTVRLHDGDGAMGRYIALSYCWGTAEQSITIKANLDGRRRGFSTESLPQTIQDAILVTRKLGIQYLWVDALCIIQDEDEFRRSEIEAMAKTYKNALLTIAASDTASVWDGFLYRRDMPPSTPIPLYLTPDRNTTVQLVSQFHSYTWAECLHYRGWAFQEFLLSPRVLLYGRFEMLWRCSKHALQPPERSYVDYPQDLGPLLLGLEMMPRKTHKIHAQVGIASEFAVLWQDTYLAGLWTRSLIRDLGWARRFLGNPRAQRQFEFVPSWSWLGLRDVVELPFALSCEDATVLPPLFGFRRMLTREEFGVGGSSIIRLRARTMQGGVLCSLGKTVSYEIKLDLEDSTVLPADAVVALLGYFRSPYAGVNDDETGVCLILQETENKAIFERIGRVTIKKGGDFGNMTDQVWSSSRFVESWGEVQLLPNLFVCEQRLI